MASEKIVLDVAAYALRAYGLRARLEPCHGTALRLAGGCYRCAIRRRLHTPKIFAICDRASYGGDGAGKGDLFLDSRTRALCHAGMVLPIGIRALEDIRDHNVVYVDITGLVYQW